MSKSNCTNVTCPTCKKPFSITYWSSVNVTLDPGLRAGVFSRSIQEHPCPTCKHTFTVDADLLYHDMKRRFIISYQPAPDGHTRPVDTRFLEGISGLMSQYQLRFVTTGNEVREKILIF